MKHKLKNGNPKPAAIRKAVALLDKLPAEFEIDMYELDAFPCGTVGCVAGAYAIARGIDKEMNCVTGADWLAQDLGFANSDAFYAYENLSIWAEENPDLWANKHGRLMFARAHSYGVSENDDITLDQVKQHWLGVANRIEARD